MNLAVDLSHGIRTKVTVSLYLKQAEHLVRCKAFRYLSCRYVLDEARSKSLRSSCLRANKRVAEKVSAVLAVE